MLTFVDCHEPNGWDPYVKWFTDDPHYSSSYYRAYGNGKLAIYEVDYQLRMVQPFLDQGDGWIGNAYNFGGPLGLAKHMPEFTRLFNDYKASNGLNERCTLNPFMAQPHDPDATVSEKEIVYVDLEKPVQLRSTTRHLVAKAADAGAVTRRVDKPDLDSAVANFEELYLQAMERKGAADHWKYPPGFFAKVLAGLGPDKSALFLTEIAGRLEVACILIFNKSVCYYHWAAAEDNVSVQGVSHFQVAQIANWAQARRMNKLHLGGGIAPRDGLFTFKAGFSNLTLPCKSYETYAVKEAAA